MALSSVEKRVCHMGMWVLVVHILVVVGRLGVRFEFDSGTLGDEGKKEDKG